MANVFAQAWLSFYGSLNFFRLHVLFFTFTPLIFAGIFYAANGQYPVTFIDALFNCVSAITVTGLATVDLSQLTGFQQALLFVQMCIGSPVVVSWLIVYVRRRFFRNELSHIISEELKRERQGGIMAAMRERTISISRSFSRDHTGPSAAQPAPVDMHEKVTARPGFLRRLANRVNPNVAPANSPASTVSGAATPSTDGTKRKSGLAQRLRTDMIRRIETAPQRVDPMGGVGGLVVGEDGVIGAKGKGPEPNGQDNDEKRVEYSNGEQVQQTTSGSAGSQSRTRYDGSGSLAPEPRLRDSGSDSGSRSRRDDNGPVDHGPELGVVDDDEHHIDGISLTPRHGPDTLSPRFCSSNVPPRTPATPGPAPYMESPSGLNDHDGGILRHPDQDQDIEGVTDDDQEGSHVSDDPLPRPDSRGRSMAEGDALSSPRAGVSSSPVQFKPPPIRITPGTLVDDRLSPGRGREFAHERQGSEAATFREAGTGEFPRTQTIEFVNTPHVRGRAGARRQSAGVNSERERERMRFRNFTMSPGSVGGAGPGSDAGDTSSNGLGNIGSSSHGHGPTGRHRANSTGRQRMGSVSTAYFPRTATGRSYGTTRMNPSTQIPSSRSGYGGFPMPHELAGRAFRRFFPNTLTLPRTLTGGSGGEAREVPYISFNALVGRNSQFHDLSPEEQEELGGVEYRALGALLWVVAGYHFGSQLLAFVIIAPYSTISKWAPVFTEQQHRFVPPVWFAAFQCASAYTNSGMSLVDQSMVPFQTGYPMIIVLFFLILAGNTAFPIFLRFTIWVLSKIASRRTRDTLHFLLDHPRRCFIYLFPSHQTWFLFIVLLSMILTDWISFLVLDIGNDVVEAIPVGTRVAIGLLQASAVRAAGFATLSLSALAPAVKVLYVAMMYVAVYPIALSVRSTNVYEEQSLGIYLDEENEEEPNPSGGPIHAWGSYLAWHARRQLSFDMWWLAFALWLLCIIERAEIVNPESNGWFDIFTIIFELTSAYGTVGLSLGLPTANYSFSGALKPLSKLVICIVMLRGRHRGLPHAIDRAVVLPREYMDDATTQSANNSGLDLPGNRQSMGGEPVASFDGGHSSSRAPAHGVDLKHRTNTLLSPVHEILTPVTSATNTPKPSFSGIGPSH